MHGFFSAKSKHWNVRLSETNFVPDIRDLALDPYPERGNRTSILRLAMASSSLGLHVMGVSEGTYVTAHRHGAGAHVIVIKGQGYELFFMPGEEKTALAFPPILTQWSRPSITSFINTSTRATENTECWRFVAAA
jgi:hypothetical protein